MANEFKIVISAVDRASQTVRNINDRISRITRPVHDVRRSMSGLGRELGLNKVSASFGKVANSVKAVAVNARSIAAPVAAVVGIGSLAGVAALANEWGRMGMEVANTSRNLGIATTTLQSLRGAAQLAGVSSESLSGGMLALGDTINDAKWGRNQGAVALMSRLGMGFHQTQDGSIDTVRSLKDLSHAIAAIPNVETQHFVARQFGVEALLPLLRQGDAAIDAYQAKVASLGGVQSAASIATAAQFGVQVEYLKIATQGLRNSIADKLTPVLMPLLEQLTNWIAKNRELIAGKVADFVQGIALWLQKIDFNKVMKGVTDTANAVGKAVDAFGGWKNVIGALVGLNIVSSLAPLVSLGLALGGIGAGLVGLAASTAGLAILAALAAYAGYKGAEFLFGDKPKKPVDSAGTSQPGLHLRTKADLYADANRQRVEAGLPPLAPRKMMSKGDLKQEARQQWIGTFGIPRAPNVTGVPDAAGSPGLPGAAGVPGIPGMAGAPGSPGSSGMPGAAGIPGIPGMAGAPGSPGSSGMPGAPGLPALGIRSNNPANLMPGGREAVFPTMEAGIAAAFKNLQGPRYFGGGNDTAAGIVNTWSPPNAPGNSPAKNANYIAGVEREVGSGHLDSSDPQTMAKLLSAMIKQENGNSYDKPKMDETIQRVVVELRNAPAGTTATARSNNEAPTPVRVGTFMPGMAAP